MNMHVLISTILSHVQRMTSSSADDEVILEKVKDKGVITLNRPKALNALNLSMIRTIYPKLQVSMIGIGI